MTELKIDRRDMLSAATLLAAGAASAAAAQTPPPAASPAFAPQPIAKPFDPAAVPGLSANLLNSHFDNNYTGAVTRLRAIDAQLAGLDPAAAPNFTLNGLKREELIAWNSMILHELYFSTLGAPTRPGAALARQIEKDFGSDAKWRAQFSAMGKALGGGSGWVLLTWSARDKRLVNTWAADHTMTLAGGTPVLALDMYEHAYAIDFGSRAAAYVDAFMAAIKWTAADAAFAKASA